MGKKYEINYRNYNQDIIKSKQTNFCIVAITLLALYSIKYDIVDIRMRK